MNSCVIKTFNRLATAGCWLPGEAGFQGWTGGAQTQREAAEMQRNFPDRNRRSVTITLLHLDFLSFVATFDKETPRGLCIGLIPIMSVIVAQMTDTQ